MDKPNFMSDLSDVAKNLLASAEKPSSNLKRKADEISQNPYEDANKELRELYLMRKKMRENNIADEEPQKTERTLIDLSNIEVKPSQGKSIAKENKIPQEEVKIDGGNVINEKPQEILQTKTITAKGQSPASINKPKMWINKLRYYPNDFLLNNMITFKQILYEDLLKDNPQNPTRTLQSAFMTTFGYSFELLEPLLKGGVKLVLADEWSNPSEPKIERNHAGYSNFILIRSPKDPSRKFTGAFHPKLWLLKFPTFLRVVISSGNLTIGDWTIWSNCLWFRDFPKKSTMIDVPKKDKVPETMFDFDEDFTQTLKSFVQSLMPLKCDYKSLLELDIDDYYISDIDIVLIPSVAGRHTGNDLGKYGHRRVAEVLKKIGFPEEPKNKKYVMTYQTSSVGNLDEKFLKEVLSSFLPNYLTLEDLKNEKKPKGKKGASDLSTNLDPASKRVRLIFPPKDYIENSLEGPDYAGCLILNSQTYNKPTFPKDIFYQFQGTEDYAFHDGIIPHLKVFVVTEENGEIDDNSYIYFGSHNFSPSAWGRYEKEHTQLSISNSELGILVPPGKGTKAKKIDIVKNLSFKFPPEKYRSDQVPWMYGSEE